MTDTTTSQNTDLSSWITLYKFHNSDMKFMDTLQRNKLQDAWPDATMTVTLENTALWNVRWGSLVEIHCFRGSC